MASLLAMLEAKERARLGAVETDYGRQYDYPAMPYYHGNVEDDLADEQSIWLNGYVEPSVQQVYNNLYRQFEPLPYHSDNKRKFIYIKYIICIYIL